MKKPEFTKMSVEELKTKLVELRKELFNLRFEHSTSQLEKTSTLSQTKKNIARVLTALSAQGVKKA